MNNYGAEPAYSFMQDGQRLFRQPTIQELSRPIYGQMHDVRVHAREDVRNEFAYLLNRGSSLE